LGLLAVLVNAIVHLRPENPPPKPTGYVYMVNGVLPIAPPLRDPRLDAVLVMEPTEPRPPAQAAAPPPLPVEVLLYGARFLPEVIVAAPGAQIIFRNDDRRPVTLLCQQAKEMFPSTPLPPGSRLAVLPPGPGQYELRSVEYPHLQATLLVPRGPASHLSFGSLGEVGVAQFDVPEGNYQAKLFFLHRYVASKDVAITSFGVDSGGGEGGGKTPKWTQGQGPGQKKNSEFVLRAVWPAALQTAAPSP
jgi:hypothetical protein